MKVRLILLLVSAIGLSAAGCGAGQDSAQPASPSTSSSTTPVAVATVSPPPSGLQLRYEGNAQVELIAREASRVLVDVVGEAALSSPPAADDIRLTTHAHADHQSYAFVQAFPGRQLHIRQGSVSGRGVKVVGVSAAHTEGDAFKAKDGTDYIYVIDIGGLRVAHFGDIGQSRLAPEQAKAVGHVDVAITQFENPFSKIDAVNKRGFKLMRQVKPRLIIQTHSSLPAVKYAATLWPLLYSKEPVVTVTKDALPQKTSLLLLGTEGAYYTQFVKAHVVKW